MAARGLRGRPRRVLPPRLRLSPTVSDGCAERSDGARSSTGVASRPDRARPEGHRLLPGGGACTRRRGHRSARGNGWAAGTGGPTTRLDDAAAVVGHPWRGAAGRSQGGGGRRPPQGPAHADEWTSPTRRSLVEDAVAPESMMRAEARPRRQVRHRIRRRLCPRAPVGAVLRCEGHRRPTTTFLGLPPVLLRDDSGRAGNRRVPGARKRGVGSWWESSPLLSGREMCVGVVGCSGGVLLSHDLSVAVPSALEGLASGFGMGPGVSPPL